LLYRRQDILMAQAFDTQRLRVAGDAFPVVEGVGASANSGHGAFALSQSGVLAHSASGDRRQQLVWFDRTGHRLETVLERTGSFAGFSISPDGRTLAFGASGDEVSSDIWLQTLNETVTFGFAGTASPRVAGP
jgi:dipeptidyl aminopeptidase/acylaminoacyl peptidase